MSINTNISPSLHPNNVTSIEGYDNQVAQYLTGTLEAFNTAYSGLNEIYKAKAAAAKNPAWNEASQILQVAQFAEKHLIQITKKFDSALADLNKRITAIDEMLSTPLTHAAGVGPVNTEIRAHVKAMRTEDRYEFLKTAQNAGDITTLSAVLGAPAYLSGMTQLDRDTHTRAYHEMRAPDAMKQLNAMKRARDLIHSRGGLVFTETQKAIGASPQKVQMLRQARDEAESAFIVRDAK